MNNKEINQLIIGALANLFLIGYLMNKVWAGNDKAIILVIFFYPVIIVANSLIWMVSKSRVFKWITIALFILFFPVLLISSLN